MSVEVPTWSFPEHLSGLTHVTHHCRAIYRRVPFFDPSQKRAAVKILRKIANVLDDAEPEPAPTTSPTYEELVRLSVPPEDRSRYRKSSQPQSQCREHNTSIAQETATCQGPQLGTRIERTPAKRDQDFETAGGSLAQQPPLKRTKLDIGDKTGIQPSPVLPATQCNPPLETTNTLILPTTEHSRPASPSLPSKDAAFVLMSLTSDESLFVPEASPTRGARPRLTTLDAPEDKTSSSVLHAISTVVPISEKETSPKRVNGDDATVLEPELPTTKLMTKSRRGPRSSQLEDITYSLSVDVNQERIIGLRDEFFEKLRDKRLVVQVSQQPQGCGFTEAEATDITNLLFTDLIGWPALKRLRALLTEYRTSSEDQIGLHGVARAEYLAKHASTPLRFREYFASVSRATRLALNEHALNRTPLQFNNIQGIIEIVETHRLYGEIMQAADEGDASITSFLLQEGYKKRQRGPTWKSAAKQFIRDTLNLSTTALDLQRQQAETVTHMVQLFGTGIIPIFPVHALWKLRKWGLQRMKAALTLFKQVFPFLEEMSETLNRYVYIPITEGLEIPLKYTKLSGTTPLFELIEGAVLVRARKQFAQSTTRNPSCDYDPPWPESEEAPAKLMNDDEPIENQDMTDADE